MQQRHARKRQFVPQVPFVTAVPVIDALDHRQPAPVVKRARELRDPWAHAVGGAFRDPQSNLRLALHGVLPAVRLLEAHAEDPSDGPPPHDRPQFLRALAIGPRRGEAMPRLVVRELDVRDLARGLEVRWTVRNEARIGIRGADPRIEMLPKLGEPCLPPRNELTPLRIPRIGRPREFETGSLPEILL